MDCRESFSTSVSQNVFNVMEIGISAVFVLVQSFFSRENSGRKYLGGAERPIAPLPKYASGSKYSTYITRREGSRGNSYDFEHYLVSTRESPQLEADRRVEGYRFPQTA